MKDGIVVFYNKDGTLYPVALTQEQVDRLPMLQMILGKITIVGDQPQGKAVDILTK
jgi:hypothetical protein